MPKLYKSDKRKFSNAVKTVPPGLPLGFKVNGLKCGIKRSKDLGLIYSDVPAQAAGFFTTNRIQAAPLKVTKEHIKNKRAQAVIVNSGNANCLTGRCGIKDALRITALLGKELGIDKEEVLIASTGIIGRELPMDRITKSLASLVKGLKAGNLSSFAEAIMTTDSSPKMASIKLKISTSTVTLTGIAKGAGMISPRLATMLAFFVTDADISYRAMRRAFHEAVANSFNLISVDGDMSTNDTALILANGLASNPKINLNDKYFPLFFRALNCICLKLAKMIVADGEGATKVIKVCVRRAKNKEEAKRIAFKVANSNLVKTAVNGNDPNWGRIAAAVGASGAKMKENELDLYLGDRLVLSKGAPQKESYSQLQKLWRGKEVEIGIDLKNGKAEASVFGCDLSEEYVRLNAQKCKGG